MAGIGGMPATRGDAADPFVLWVVWSKICSAGYQSSVAAYFDTVLRGV